ncbi:MAG: UDP-2,3-diacylglucosamine diphosphatase [Candidatus Edwardsbacteria bacterium]|nr:UDP-2,3-diacylglucosamine diphosphatase [Candidatus Edwardsbacteria bacterium]
MSSMIYFLSDAHLGAGPAETEELKKANLVRLFDRVKADKADLYILGDLFDFWFEYKTVVPKEHLDVIAMLKDLRRAGIRMTFIAGNHDFWAGSYFEHDLGIKIIRSWQEITVDDRRFFLAHGDGLEKGDWGYKYLLKPVLRNQISVWLYSLLHPDLAIPFAMWLSRISRDHLTKHKYLKGNPLLDVARGKFKQGFDYVVLGHCHRPKLTKTDRGAYLNLGDFFSHFTYGVYRGGVLSLENI